MAKANLAQILNVANVRMESAGVGSGGNSVLTPLSGLDVDDVSVSVEGGDEGGDEKSGEEKGTEVEPAEKEEKGKAVPPTGAANTGGTGTGTGERPSGERESSDSDGDSVISGQHQGNTYGDAPPTEASFGSVAHRTSYQLFLALCEWYVDGGVHASGVAISPSEQGGDMSGMRMILIYSHPVCVFLCV